MTAEGYIAPLRVSLFLRHCFAVTCNVDVGLKGTYRHVTHTLGLHEKQTYKASCNSEPRHNGRPRGYGEYGRQDSQQPGPLLCTDDDLYVRSYTGETHGVLRRTPIPSRVAVVSLFFFPSCFLLREHRNLSSRPFLSLPFAAS